MSEGLLSCVAIVLLIRKIKLKCFCVSRPKISLYRYILFIQFEKNIHMIKVMAN